jgi:hypothetical protein
MQGLAYKVGRLLIKSIWGEAGFEAYCTLTKSRVQESEFSFISRAGNGGSQLLLAQALSIKAQ